jgi:signal transduction histidine kinase
MRYEDIESLVLATTALFILVTGFIIYFVILYRNKQLRNKQEQQQLQASFRQELLKTRIEMQEQTLQHVSREIHDNITQVLSFVKLDLSMIATADEQLKQIKINESRDLLAQAITDLRDLSKSLSFEHISNFGLLKTIEAEAARLNKSGIIQVAVSVEGNIIPLGEQRELVLFRIFQEALNNTLKHAQAGFFKINLQYSPQLFNLTLEDDGKGFRARPGNMGDGSGMKNIENRAALIGAVCKIDSSPGNGCSIKINLNPLEERLYTDGNYPYRIS